MQIYFLEADKPVKKRYFLDPKTGEILKEGYPFVYNFTSSTQNPYTLNDFTDAIRKESVRNSTLIKGKLNRSLNSESRAGATNPEEPTDWVCLDLDGINNYQNVDEFLSDIGCGDVDYVLQWSSSMRIENDKGFRCHIFMALDKATRPQLLKQWLKHLNLTRNTIAAQIELTKTGNALRWPLDITTCQNDKLIYIAPPELGKGIPDPYPKPTDRIVFHQRGKRVLDIDFSLVLPAKIDELENQRLNDLRIKAGITKPKAPKFKYSGTIEYMTNPSRAVVSDIKEERGFTYLNLNGGDSWGYYHPTDNPQFIFNFKGEPVYRTRDLLPGYWAKITTSNANKPNPTGKIHLAFREFSTGLYWNGRYDPATDSLELHQAKSETQLRHYMLNNGLELGETVPDWDRVFEPNNDYVIDTAKQVVNIYNPSEYFKNRKPAPANIPPVCDKIIDHVLGNDPLTRDHFINWLACIVQRRERAGTAWVLQGTQGTGKGLLFHNILAPLFGHENVTAKRMEELESEFTGFMENKFIVFIDEIETGKSLYHAKITAKLKNLIVEPVISIRNMYRPPYMAPNFASMIFASNRPGPVEVAPDDRRFNVGMYQEHKLQITSQEVDTISSELPDLYAHLMNYPADPNRARTPLINSARSTLIDISRTAIDTVSDALVNGNFETLWDLLPSSKALTTGTALLTARNISGQAFRDLLVDIATTGQTKLSRDDLFVIFEYAVGNMPTSPNKLAALLKHHRIHLGHIWKGGRTVRGIDVQWKFDPVWLKQIQTEIQNGTV